MLPFRLRALDWIAGGCVCCVQGLFPSGCLSDSACQPQALFQLRVQNPDGFTLIPARTRWYHLQLCDSAPWWKCLGWVT